ncbi:unnamed protein product [Pleuronectes platessa]|uniref:Uncharacterized protein n=1 Tax=Pleuronectes platessa TaxID=8262 RepID=A0A9N7Z491_PLEPL|nr:unnamed protein product [Pleuronectes platessa]
MVNKVYFLEVGEYVSLDTASVCLGLSMAKFEKIQLYKPNSTGRAGVILPADAQAHPATGALRAWAQSTTPQTATQTLAIMPPFTHSSLIDNEMEWEENKKLNEIEAGGEGEERRE